MKSALQLILVSSIFVSGIVQACDFDCRNAKNRNQALTMFGISVAGMFTLVFISYLCHKHKNGELKDSCCFSCCYRKNNAQDSHDQKQQQEIRRLEEQDRLRRAEMQKMQKKLDDARTLKRQYTQSRQTNDLTDAERRLDEKMQQLEEKMKLMEQMEKDAKANNNNPENVIDNNQTNQQPTVQVVIVQENQQVPQYIPQQQGMQFIPQQQGVQYIPQQQGPQFVQQQGVQYIPQQGQQFIPQQGMQFVPQQGVQYVQVQQPQF